MNTAFTLALVAGAAQAATWGRPQQQWGRPQQQWGQPSWGGHQHQHEQSHNPWDSSADNHHNPWAYQQPSKPEGWYSPTQQYTAPQIQYIPAQKTMYAVCEIAEVGDIELAQLPGHPIYVRSSVAGSRMEMVEDDMVSVANNFTATINEKGRLGDSCDATGDEFNPLFETDKWGNPNPYQDPSRGRLDFPYADEEPSELMQNLSGHNSILGRSITLTDDDDEDALVGCCVIALDMAPMAEEPAVDEPMVVDDDDKDEHDHHHHGHYNHFQPQYNHFQPQYNHFQPQYSHGPSYRGQYNGPSPHSYRGRW